MHADRHLSRFQDKNPALSTNRCWFLGEDGEDCSSVCGGLEAVDVEGTRAGSSSYAVVTCIEAEILGGSNIRHGAVSKPLHPSRRQHAIGPPCLWHSDP